LLALAVASCATTGGLSHHLPRGTPPAGTLAGWERADGEAQEGDQRILYQLYVNPQRPGLYEVTRFRVDRVAQQGDRTRRVETTEKLVWNARPGTRAPLVCYERVGRRSWRTLWFRRWSWRQLVPDTDEYRAAMFTAIRVYNLHRARLGLPPPG
jgi:hypothetical protein